MRSLHFAFTFLVALGSSTPASGEDAARVHPTDGLPPIGDHGSSHGYNGNGCQETYETLSLTLDHVTIDGVDGPLVTDVQGTSVPVSEITKSDLSADTTEPGYVDFDLKLTPAFVQDAGVWNSAAVFSAR